MNLELTYSLQLPTTVADILDKDFWMFTDLTAVMVAPVNAPVKFSSAVSVMVDAGECSVDINLRRYTVKGPCLVNINAGEILQVYDVSADFHAKFVVMSKNFARSLFMYINDIRTLSLLSTYPVVPLREEIRPEYDDFYKTLSEVMGDTQNPHLNQAVLFMVLGFYFRVASRTYSGILEEASKSPSRLSDRFISLVEEHFRTERFLDFYAAKLSVTPKHLSRAIKQQTGKTAAEWIERFVILEAKVLLKSSSLNVQQISELLNFPSQSFFGKYFKKYTGMSPKEFRNS